MSFISMCYIQYNRKYFGSQSEEKFDVSQPVVVSWCTQGAAETTDWLRWCLEADRAGDNSFSATLWVRTPEARQLEFKGKKQ